MSQLSFCMVTPSYAPDFERCKLLCRSIEQFISPSVPHYIIVDRSDYALFRQLEGENTTVLLKEEILPWWIKKVPFIKKNVWLSFGTLPIRGWLIQQIIKIGVAHVVKEDVLAFVDSDVAFLKSFDFHSLEKDGKVRFYHKPACIPADMEQGHYNWYKSASELLGVPTVDFPAPDYINQIVTWRRDNAINLCKKLEEVHQKSWIQVLGNSWNLSEYVLYGTFVDQVLRQDTGHYYEDNDICFNYYSEETISDQQLELLFENIPDDRVAIMLSAKAGIPISRYSKFVLSEKQIC